MNRIEIDKDHIIIFDSFKNVKLNDEADLIFVDPPFGISFNANMHTYNRKPDAINYLEIDKERYFEFIKDLVEWCYNTLKPTGSLWIVSGWNNLRYILDAIEDQGFYTLNHCIWKYQFGVYTKKRFVTSHYHLLLLVKDLKNYTFNKPEHYAEDVWYIKRDYKRGLKTAGNELPDKLVEKCIITSSNEGDLVIDPCLGSGTTMKVSIMLKRRCIGIELNSILKERIVEKLGIKV
jgi:site-specific DNA-methyltransferase (adenine-specific)